MKTVIANNQKIEGALAGCYLAAHKRGHLFLRPVERKELHGAVPVLGVGFCGDVAGAELDCVCGNVADAQLECIRVAEFWLN
jgi:hypothetical protein